MEGKSEKKEIKLFNILSQVSLYTMLAIGILLILIFTQVLPMYRLLTYFMVIILSMSLGCFTAMPWAKRYENQDTKKISLVFLIISGIFTLILMIIGFLLVRMFYQMIYDGVSPSEFVKTLNFIQFGIVFSIQFCTSAIIVNKYFKYRTLHIPEQCLTGLALFILDLYVSTAVYIFHISSGDFGIRENIANFLVSKLAIALLIIAVFILTFFQSVKMRRKRRSRRLGVNLEDESDKRLEKQMRDQQIAETTIVQNTDNTEEKLKKLKDLYEKGLITEQEYETKKQNILAEM